MRKIESTSRNYSPRAALRCGRLNAFPSDEKAFAAGAWFLGINGNKRAAKYAEENGLAITKSQGEGINTSGGFVVPDEIMRTIIALRETRGAFRATASIVPMGSDSINIPRRTTGLTAYFTAENSALIESDASWGAVGLVAKKLATLTRSSSELDEDAAIDFGEWFVTEIAYAFASKEDDCGFNGDGTSTYGGTRGVTKLLIDSNHDAGKVIAATGHDTFAEIDGTDLANLMAKLPAFALPGARWFCSQMGYALVFCRLAMSSGGITMQPVNGRMLPHFQGFPVQVSQVLPQTTGDLSGSVMLMFGDMALAAALGERRGVTVARSDKRYVDTDQILWRGTERVDVNVHDLGDNATAGPIVGLVGE